MVFVFLFALGMLLLCYALLKFRRCARRGERALSACEEVALSRPLLCCRVVRWFLRFL